MQNSQKSFRRPESILLVIYTLGGRTLLLKRTPPHSFWQSVTGSMNWNSETPKQAAMREMFEETGIHVRLSEIKDWDRKFKFPLPKQVLHRYSASHRTNTESIFSVCLPGEVEVSLRSQEHIDYQWVDIEAAQDIVWSWSNREALRMVWRSIASN